MRFPARFRRACVITCLVILVWKFILGGDFSSAPSTIESYVPVLLLSRRSVEYAAMLTNVTGMLQVSSAGNPLSQKTGILTFNSVAD